MEELFNVHTYTTSIEEVSILEDFDYELNKDFVQEEIEFSNNLLDY